VTSSPLFIRGLIFVLLFLTVGMSPASAAERKMGGECVILLHGLARTTASMESLEKALNEAGYHVVNLGYPSRKHPIKKLTEIAIPPAINVCQAQLDWRIHFVTHSLGGILVRQYLATHKMPGLGRTVMISPPSQGSEVVDSLKNVPGFHLINGPAGDQLGTGPDSVPLALGPANFEVGIITGTRSINLILSRIIPGLDDGKVSVERARLEGMTDFVTLPHSHPFIMGKKKAISQTIHFLKQGRFDHAKARTEERVP